MTTFASLGGKIDEEGGLKFIQHLYRAGYSYGLAVSQRGAGANMSVDVAVGGAMTVTSSDIPHYGWTTATVNATVSAADPSNPRKDIVVLYLDLTLITDATTNNVGATKFTVVAGTPGASPTAPDDSDIQTALGAGIPFLKLARIDVASGATTVVNGNLTDLRTPMVGTVPYLYGGGSNTKGHLIPNVADDTVALLNATQSFGAGKTLTAPSLVSPSISGTPSYPAGSINTADFADASVTTAKIADGNVTSAKLVEGYVRARRQDDTTNSNLSDQRIQFGWGWKTGTSADNMAETVTFPTAFSGAPVVLIGLLGTKTSDPSVIGDLTSAYGGSIGFSIGSVSVTTSTFSAAFARNTGTFSSGTRYGYSWIAIGPA